MPERPMRQFWRDMGYGAKIVFSSYLAFITIVGLILSTRDTLAVKPEALLRTGGVYFALMAMMLCFLPSFAAWGKRIWGAIFLLNLILGWMLIGWIFALLWGWTIK